MSFEESALGSEYLKFCSIRRDALRAGVVDLSAETWFYPTKLLPLAIFKGETVLPFIPPDKQSALGYYNFITDPTQASPDADYVPFIRIPTDKDLRNRLFEPLETIDDQGEVGGKNAVRYVVEELVDNIYEHSGFLDAYVMAQKYPLKKFVEITIIDNGVSIPGSFETAEYEFENDAKALSKAVRGLSTKEDVGRGYGLGSSLNLITRGLSGQCLIVSRKGGLIADEKETYYKMPEDASFSGTLISIRIPYQSKEVNIYEYIE